MSVGRMRWLVFYALFGVLLPAITVVVEAATGICAEAFFDPIPSVWHALLVAFVPLANAQALLAINRDDHRHVRVLSVANGIATGVSLFYSLLFLPLSPLAVFGVLYMGLGLLPLSPFFALAAAVACRRHLRRMAAESGARLPRAWPLVACALALLVLVDLRAVLTRVRMHEAATADAARSLGAVEWLRSYGDGQTMLRACYQRGGVTNDLISFALSLDSPLDTSRAREVYYRVTGEPYTAAPPPEGLSRWANPAVFDENQGGEAVGGLLEGLSLAASRVDGSLDPDAAVGYLEWTLVFRNDSAVQREARAQVALPPGAAVSRLTLWVNGEEREAAFAGRAQVREAYERVVRARRDPVLVTTSGPDRVLVQCFPVPPGGGEMKVRIGVTAPLDLESRERASLGLPHFLERNFATADVRHEVWIEAKRPLSSPGGALAAERPAPGVYAVRGAAEDAALAGAAGLVVASRSPEVVEAFAEDPAGVPGAVVRQTIGERASAAPSRVVLAVDGSAAMRRHAEEIAGAIRALPDGLEVGVVAAGDAPVLLSDARSTYPEMTAAIANQVRDFEYAGGRDNAAALARAWDLAAGSPRGAVVWIHGPQPLLLPGADLVRHRFERRPGAVALLELQVEPGPNRLAEALDGVEGAGSVARSGSPGERLRRLFASWAPGATELVAVRERLAVAEGAPGQTTGAHRTSSHVARLWARDEVARLLAAGGDEDRAAAAQLAAAYRLVTPVTGAVVLETAEQFEAAGLEPAGAATVPTIPEPEVWLLAAVALAALWWAARGRRRASCATA